VSRSLGLAVLPALSACVLLACGGELDNSELDRHLCREEMFGGDVRQSAVGELKADDLARLGNGDGQPPVGAISAKFALYTTQLPRPPFDPPGDIVCQVVEFESEAAAAAWVDGLTAARPLHGVVIGFLADGGFRLEEQFPAEEKGLRIFATEPGDQREGGLVVIAIGADRQFVRAVALSGRRFIDSPAEVLAEWWREAAPN